MIFLGLLPKSVEEFLYTLVSLLYTLPLLRVASVRMAYLEEGIQPVPTA